MRRPRPNLRIAAITSAALGFLFTAQAAFACATIHTSASERKAERAAFRKADLVLTVDAETESYVAVPGRLAGTMRVGVGTGKIVEVHKGPTSLRGRTTTYLVADGEDAMGCAADAPARPGSRYKLYLSWGAGSAPPMTIYSEMIVETEGFVPAH